MEQESAGIQALLYTEKTSVQHSELILGLLEKAIHQFKVFNSPRSENHLKVTMAEELKSAQKYEEAMDILRPVIEQYRIEGWRTLLDAVLALAVKCSYLRADIAEYLRLTLDLTSADSTLDLEEKTRMLTNIVRLFDPDGPKVPSAEPGLTSKSERQAVGEASSKWVDVLKGQSEVIVELGEVKSCIEVKVAFKTLEVRENEPLVLDVFVKNRTPLPVPLLGVDPVLTNPTLKLEWVGTEGVEVIQPGKTCKRRARFFATEAETVKANVGVAEIRTRVGLENGFSATVVSKVKLEDKSAIELVGKDFIVVPAKKAGGGDEVDLGEIDLDDLEDSVASASVFQREPKMTMTLEISRTTVSHKQSWSDLWREYLRFYETELPDEIFESSFNRFSDPNIDNMYSWLAWLDGSQDAPIISI